MLKQVKQHKRQPAIWHCAKLMSQNNIDKNTIRESDIEEYARIFLSEKQDQYCNDKELTVRMFYNFVGEVGQTLIDVYEKEVKWAGQ